MLDLKPQNFLKKIQTISSLTSVLYFWICLFAENSTSAYKIKIIENKDSKRHVYAQVHSSSISDSQ